MNVLVTGARGFIGRALTAELDRRGISWVGFEGDILDAAAFDKYEACGVVVHLAGITRTGSSYAEQRHMVDVNIVGTLNASGFAQAGGRRLVFASTCCYGNPEVLPVPETEPIVYHEPYSFSKWMGERQLKFWGRNFGLDGVIMRIFNVYGPGQPERFLIPDMITKIAKGRLKLRNLTAVRDFIYIDDLARIMADAVEFPKAGMLTVNAGTGEGVSVGNVVDVFERILGRTLEIEDEGLPEFVPKSIADVTLARRLYGWEPKVSLEQGVSRVLASHGMLPGGPGEDA